jgi:phosphonate transport system substrate-binding protein
MGGLTAPRPSRRLGRRLHRRRFLAGSLAAGSAAICTPVLAQLQRPVQFGLTPVFLTNDLDLLTSLRSYLSRHTGFEVQLVRRRTYQEITTLLLSGQLEAAWICGYPFVAFREQLSLVGVPVWRGRPLYSSYLITAASREAGGVVDLEGDIHAFSDPDSNSGHLVTRALLTEIGRRPEEFFRRTIFTYGHRNVVRAVGSRLVMSGSVDGYVYDVLAETEPSLTRDTRVLRRSELLGFPPVACLRSMEDMPPTKAIKTALLTMADDSEGRDVLRMLMLDGFTEGAPELFDGVATKLRQVRSFG